MESEPEPGFRVCARESTYHAARPKIELNESLSPPTLRSNSCDRDIKCSGLTSPCFIYFFFHMVHAIGANHVSKRYGSVQFNYNPFLPFAHTRGEFTNSLAYADKHTHTHGRASRLLCTHAKSNAQRRRETIKARHIIIYS